MNILYKQEKLPFTCRPAGAAQTGTILDIILWKNSTLGWKQIAKIWLKVGNGAIVNEIIWTDTAIRNRAATIDQKVHPSSQTGLQIEVSPINVKYSDKEDYKCSISGNSGSVSIGSESAPKTVRMKGKKNYNIQFHL